jgi:UDP-GlcNAc3NAcA epimerase
MLDAALRNARIAESRASARLRELPARFALATLHRAENTDEPARLLAILEGLERVASSICPVLLPAHPRTSKILAGAGWTPRAVKIIEPVSYFDMLLLERAAELILTDSGGVQKEAYFFETPCVTFREETEWVETLQNGCNRLAPAAAAAIVEAAAEARSAGPWLPLYGEGDAAVKICRRLLDQPRAVPGRGRIA